MRCNHHLALFVLSMALFIQASSAFDLVVQNKLFTNIEHPLSYLPMGGLEFAPKTISSGNTNYFTLKNTPNMTYTGIITLPLPGYSFNFSLAWSLDPAFPWLNKVGVYAGTNESSSTLLDDVLANAQNATEGWVSKTFGAEQIHVRYFMSSTIDNAGIIVELAEA